MNDELSALAQLLGLTNQAGIAPVYRSQTGNFLNTSNYNPNTDIGAMIRNLMQGMFFPNAQQIAPRFMTQFDFEQIQQNTQLRGATNAMYEGLNPAAIIGINNALTNLTGADTSSYFVDQTGNLTSAGRIIGDMSNRLFGLSQSPYATMGQMQNTIRDSFQGLIVDDGSFSRYGRGISNRQSAEVVDLLMRGTYSDDMYLQQSGTLNNRDMIEIARMGRDFSVFEGATGAGELARRTLDFSSVIEQGMQTFNTEDKSRVLQNILDITGGDISLSDTGRLQEVLEKVKTLSQAANVSIDVLKATVQRGREVAQQLDIEGITGAEITADTINQMQLTRGAMNRTGAGVEQVAGLEVSQRTGDIATSDVATTFAASPMFRRLGALAQAMESRGMDASPIYDRIRDQINTGAAVNQDFVNELTSNLQAQFSEEGVDIGGVNFQRFLRSNERQGVELIRQRLGSSTFLNTALVNTLRVARLSENDNNREFIDAFLEGDQGLTQTQFRYVTDLFQRDLESRLGLPQDRANAVATNAVNQFINRDEIEEERNAQRLIQLRRRSEEDFLQRTTDFTPANQRIFQTATAGGSFTEILRRVFPNARDIGNIADLTPEELANIDEEGLVNYVNDFFVSDRGNLAFREANRVASSKRLSRDEVITITNFDPSNVESATLDTALDPSLQISKDDIIAGRFDLTSFLEDGAELTTDNIRLSLSRLKARDEKAFRKFSRRFDRTRELRELDPEIFRDTSIFDIQSVSSVEELNNLPEVARIADRFGLDEFESIKAFENIIDFQGTARDKFIAARLTGKNRDEITQETVDIFRRGIEDIQKNRSFVRRTDRRSLVDIASGQGARSIITEALNVPDAVKSNIRLDDLDEDLLRADTELFGSLPQAILQQFGDIRSREDLVETTGAILDRKSLSDLRDVSKGLNLLKSFERPDESVSFSDSEKELNRLLTEDRVLGVSLLQTDNIGNRDNFLKFINERSKLQNISGLDTESLTQDEVRQLILNTQEQLRNEVQGQGTVGNNIKLLTDATKELFPAIRNFLDLFTNNEASVSINNADDIGAAIAKVVE